MCAIKDKSNWNQGYVGITAMLWLFLTGCATNDAQSDAINSQLSFQSRSEFNSHIKEWEELKPGIKRLVELEGDLRFLIAELAKANNASSSPNQIIDNTPAPITPSQPESVAVPVTSTQIDSTPSFFIDEPATNPSFFKDEPTTPEVNPRPEPEVENKDNSQDFAVPDVIEHKDKVGSSAFPGAGEGSGTRAQPPQTAATALNTEEAMRTDPSPLIEQSTENDFVVKSPIFSETITQRPSLGGPDRCATGFNKKVEGNVALHLASYSKKDSLQKGWKMLFNQYKAVLCLRSARAEMVNVRGKNFFSLRVGPYTSRDEAIKDCRTLTNQGQYCAISQFSGEAVN